LSQREPIFNVPRVVVWLLGAFVAVHLVRQVLPDHQNGWSEATIDFIAQNQWLTWAIAFLPNGTWLTEVLAFIPARLGGYAHELPGGQVATVTSFATHLFVHGDMTHLLVNSAWMLAFASPIARRAGTLRFLAFFLLTGCAGALFFTAVNGFQPVLLIGASGAISGLMGAAFRFIFSTDESGIPQLGEKTQTVPLMSLAETLRDRRIMTAVLGWVVLNVLFAWGATSAFTDAASIAWEAHIGGFAAGLLTYGFFDAPQVVHQDPGGDAAGAA
jgi:membrane associated rhomboid family serine protease